MTISFIFAHFGLNIFFFVTLKGFIIVKLVWLYCSDNLQNSKTNMTKIRDKTVNRDISNKNGDIIFFPYRPPLNSPIWKLLYSVASPSFLTHI